MRTLISLLLLGLLVGISQQYALEGKWKLANLEDIGLVICLLTVTADHKISIRQSLASTRISKAAGNLLVGRPDFGKRAANPRYRGS